MAAVGSSTSTTSSSSACSSKRRKRRSIGCGTKLTSQRALACIEPRAGALAARARSEFAGADGSASAEPRPAPLDERSNPLGGVRGCQELSLLGPEFAEGRLGTTVDSAPRRGEGCAHGERRLLSDDTCDLHRPALLPAGGYALLHQAQPQGLAGAELICGQEVALSISPAGAFHHPHGRPASGHDPARDLDLSKP